jgi:lycopene cyclase-like protein
MKHQITVIGSGPAGTALVAALCRRGLDVAWCSGDLHEPWPNNYGLWADELPQHLDDGAFEHVWDRPAVRIGDRTRLLDRAYARVDGTELRRQLLQGCEPTEYVGHVEKVSADGTIIEMDNGTKLTSRLVFDSTGVAAFLREERSKTVAAQTAYGVVARVEGEPLEGSAQMALMDFDSSFRTDDGPATFLYAMPLDDTWFLEETVLAGRPPFPISNLETHLHERLASRGARIIETFEEERCFIPMGTALPSRDQPVVGFGASAGFVHPASGYSLARSLNTAQVAAEAADGGTAADVWRAIWPDSRIQARRLYQFGMETLLTMDRASTERFFDTFFELPDDTWQPYLSDQLEPRGVQGVMLRVFAHASMSTRLQLMRAAFGPNRLTLLRGMLG